MKLGIVVGSRGAPPSAYVTLREDFARAVEIAAGIGFHGIELALRSADEVDLPALQRALSAHGLAVPCISTGQVFATDGLSFTNPDPAVREQATGRILAMIELAGELGAGVNTGRVRGSVPAGQTLDMARQQSLVCLHRCADAAAKRGVRLLIEPINRYESNFINTCQEALDLIHQAGRDCVFVMPDLFHMNIEEASFGDALRGAGSRVGYVHVADSNRWAPGWGHLPFDEILGLLDEIGYDDFLTAEILPQPDALRAAAQTFAYLAPRLERRRAAGRG
jgi:sugar phosphate isomerase/epimerase